VAVELARSKGADRELARTLERLAVKVAELEALQVAHELLGRDLTGFARGAELVRQAETLVGAGVPYAEAIHLSEPGLVELTLEEASPLVERLAALADDTDDVIEVYERQVSRTRAPGDRVRALARAAQVAAERDQVERAQGFFELALAGIPSADTLAIVTEYAVASDHATKGDQLRRALIHALSHSGTGARDGGRTRAALLRRAAQIARLDLGDIDLAFSLLGDALIAQVDDITLDVVEALGREIGSPSRSDAAFTRALSEVFDPPLVRMLLARRARLRREDLGDLVGAAADLKKLHDLSPSDRAVLEQLSALLSELGDYRAIVQLYEDLILRGKDMNVRAELARRVARMWEEQLQDPREAADAWRRVLRLKQSDPEATSGLERAKSNMLKKADPDSGIEAYAPPSHDSVAPAASAASAAPASILPETRASVALPPSAPGSETSLEVDFSADQTGEDPREAATARIANADTVPFPVAPAAIPSGRPTPRVPIDQFIAASSEFTPSAGFLAALPREVVELNSVELIDHPPEVDSLEQTLARPYRPISGEVEVEVSIEENEDSEDEEDVTDDLTNDVAEIRRDHS